MKRLFALFLMAFWAFSLLLNAAVVTFDFSTAEGITAMGYAVPAQSAGTDLVTAGPVTVSGVTLSATDGATPTRIWNSQGAYTLRIYVDGSITLSVAEGSITAVTVNAANTTNFDLLANVGDYSVNGAVGSWTGNASSVTFSHFGSKNAQVASLVVTTSSEGPGDDPDPVDPDITRLDSLVNLNTLDDGTDFQFTSDVYVNYQWHEYLWVMQLDSEGNAIAGIIYGDTGKEYQLGAVIPAGWTGTKSTYKGLVEVINPDRFGNPKNVLDEYYYSAFDCTGYLDSVNDPEQGWVNYKVSFKGIHLSDIDQRGNFTISGSEGSLAGFNKFGIDYPEVDPTELYDIEGMVTIYNGIMELYPITITGDKGMPLWRVLYDGEDGQQYKVNDTLYVAAVSDAEDGRLVYVTDNVSEIYFDLYAEWGYAEWLDWYPDWIALDCTGNDECFERLATMSILEPGTVKGVLGGLGVNPRLSLLSTPAEVTDTEYPVLTVFDYNLDEDYLAAVGNELGRIRGRFTYVDGVPSLCSAEDSVVVKLCFDYNPALEAEMATREGLTFALLSIFKLDSAWDENTESFNRRRISATADDYYTNYTVYPLQITDCSSVEETQAAKQPVDVRYINAAGVSSSQPHDGVNIVVTTYSDGTTKIAKRIVK